MNYANMLWQNMVSFLTYGWMMLKTVQYSWVVVDYEENWIEIYKALNRIFKETYWCKRELKYKNEEDNPWPRITKTQLDNYVLCKYFNYLSSTD